MVSTFFMSSIELALTSRLKLIYRRLFVRGIPCSHRISDFLDTLIDYSISVSIPQDVLGTD